MTLQLEVNNELHTWRWLVIDLAARPTHLRELDPAPPTWFGATYDSFTGMGGVFIYPEIQWFMWCSLYHQDKKVDSYQTVTSRTILPLMIYSQWRCWLRFTFLHPIYNPWTTFLPQWTTQPRRGGLTGVASAWTWRSEPSCGNSP